MQIHIELLNKTELLICFTRGYQLLDSKFMYFNWDLNGLWVHIFYTVSRVDIPKIFDEAEFQLSSGDQIILVAVVCQPPLTLKISHDEMKTKPKIY